MNGDWNIHGRLYCYTMAVALELGMAEDDITDDMVHENIIRVLLQTVFCSLPPVPIVSRWTKMFQAL